MLFQHQTHVPLKYPHSTPDARSRTCHRHARDFLMKSAFSFAHDDRVDKRFLTAWLQLYNVIIYLFDKLREHVTYECDRLRLHLNTGPTCIDFHIFFVLLKHIPEWVLPNLREQDPYGRILGFLDRSRYFFFQVVHQLYSRG
jgi:hypothetical protein